jgi:ABC-type multidrug transport system ATPase subunit
MKVTLENVCKRFDRRRVLSGVDLALPEGAIVALVGINGAGKTTLLHALAGLLALDRGTVRFDDEPFRRDRLDHRRRFMFLPDFPIFVLASTLLEYLSLVLRLYERDTTAATEPVLALLRDFDLLPLADLPLVQLSRGQLYKAALVALIAVDPDLWLLDEPLASGMDPLGLRAFQTHARRAAAAGRTIFYSTQILDVAERLSDFAAVLHDGKIRAFAPCSELRAAGASGGLTDLFARLADPYV